MQLKLPRPSRLFAAHPRSRADEHAGPDDPWAGEDAQWEAERGPPEPRAEFLRFFRGIALAAVVGAALWAALVLLLVRLF